jgi:hypothetical protein
MTSILENLREVDESLATIAGVIEDVKNDIKDAEDYDYKVGHSKCCDAELDEWRCMKCHEMASNQLNN